MKGDTIMYTVTAQYLGRQKYTITVNTGERKVEREFVEPFFNSGKAGRRINAITESLNVEEDIDVTSEKIFDAISEAARKANKPILAIAVIE